MKTWPDLASYYRMVENQHYAQASQFVEKLYQKEASPRALNAKAMVLFAQNKLDDAEKVVDLAIAKDTNQALHFALKARINLQKMGQEGNPINRWKYAATALESYRRAMVLDPQTMEFRCYVVRHLYSAPTMGGGDLKRALQLADEAVSLGLDGAMLLRAEVRLASDQLHQAVPDLQAAMGRDEFDAKTFVHAGYWALEEKKWDLAYSFFHYLTEKDPTNPDSFDCMGDYYQAIDDDGSARACYEKALKLDPDFEPSKLKMAKL